MIMLAFTTGMPPFGPILLWADHVDAYNLLFDQSTSAPPSLLCYMYPHASSIMLEQKAIISTNMKRQVPAPWPNPGRKQL
jgi:hypothetical protein